MYPFSFLARKHKDVAANRTQVQYLPLGSEPQETSGAELPSFTYPNRYLVKRQVMRRLRQLRREQLR
jgi:hypothetical protein